MKRQAWIACPLVAVILVGCKSDTESLSQVPPPAYAAEPEPLPPVSIQEGAPPAAGGSDAGLYPSPGAYEPEPLAPATPIVRTYTIQKGDTLWSIATREYGNGQKWKDISAANPSIDPKRLAVGQQITLP